MYQLTFLARKSMFCYSLGNFDLNLHSVSASVFTQELPLVNAYTHNYSSVVLLHLFRTALFVHFACFIEFSGFGDNYIQLFWKLLLWWGDQPLFVNLKTKSFKESVAATSPQAIQCAPILTLNFKGLFVGFEGQRG